MTKFVEKPSGLVVPQEKPAKRKRRYANHEVQDDKQREKVAEALSLLWDGLELSKGGGGICLNDNYDLHYHLYENLGILLLGLDCPIKEVQC